MALGRELSAAHPRTLHAKCLPSGSGRKVISASQPSRLSNQAKSHSIIRCLTSTKSTRCPNVVNILAASSQANHWKQATLAQPRRSSSPTVLVIRRKIPKQPVTIHAAAVDTMAFSRNNRYVRPVIVEAKPSNLAPESPPRSPKAVRFTKSTSVTRYPNPTEAWSLYHFENHAAFCSACHNPMDVHIRGGRLCDQGHALAQDVAIHVYDRAGEIYSKHKDNHKHVRVELPPHYHHVRSLLRVMDRGIRSTPPQHRTVPIISYDRTYPVPPRRSSAEYDEETMRYAEEPRTVVITPGDSQSHRRSGPRKSKRKSNGYRATVVQEYDSEPEAFARDAKPRERRGSLYYADRQRKEKGYRTVVHEPEEGRRYGDERRRSGYWT